MCVRERERERERKHRTDRWTILTRALCLTSASLIATHPHTHSLTYTLTLSLTHSLTHSLSQANASGRHEEANAIAVQVHSPFIWAVWHSRALRHRDLPPMCILILISMSTFILNIFARRFPSVSANINTPHSTCLPIPNYCVAASCFQNRGCWSPSECPPRECCVPPPSRGGRNTPVS